jgi:hypothetical protein
MRRLVETESRFAQRVEREQQHRTAEQARGSQEEPRRGVRQRDRKSLGQVKDPGNLREWSEQQSDAGKGEEVGDGVIDLALATPDDVLGRTVRAPDVGGHLPIIFVEEQRSPKEGVGHSGDEYREHGAQRQDVLRQPSRSTLVIAWRDRRALWHGHVAASGNWRCARAGGG